MYGASKFHDGTSFTGYITENTGYITEHTHTDNARNNVNI